MLQEDNVFVQKLIQSLLPKAKPSRGSNSQVSRAIQLMYFLFDVSLLAAFSFTGKTRSKEIDGKMCMYFAYIYNVTKLIKQNLNIFRSKKEHI